MDIISILLNMIGVSLMFFCGPKEVTDSESLNIPLTADMTRISIRNSGYKKRKILSLTGFLFVMAGIILQALSYFMI